MVLLETNCQADLSCVMRERTVGAHDPLATVSPRIRMLSSTGAEIAGTKPTTEDVAYMHAILCQIGLPRSRVNGERFERASGSASLVVRSGELWNGQRMVPQIVPYGPIPRLMLAYMTRYAVRHRKREIPFGDSVNDALRLFGITKGGRSYAMFRTQVSALAACSIALGFNAGLRALTFDGKPVQQFEAWLSDAAGQRSLWPSCVTLGRDFYETLLEHPVPHDVRALGALRGSALAMDAYLWLASRLWRVRGKAVLVRWHQLKTQFGQEYGDVRNFKRKLLLALREVRVVYPTAKVEEIAGGLLLRPSPPAVSPGRGSGLCTTL